MADGGFKNLGEYAKSRTDLPEWIHRAGEIGRFLDRL
jgi:hypothetical protein